MRRESKIEQLLLTAAESLTGEDGGERRGKERRDRDRESKSESYRDGH